MSQRLFNFCFSELLKNSSKKSKRPIPEPKKYISKYEYWLYYLYTAGVWDCLHSFTEIVYVWWAYDFGGVLCVWTVCCTPRRKTSTGLRIRISRILPVLYYTSTADRNWDTGNVLLFPCSLQIHLNQQYKDRIKNKLSYT